MGQELPPLLLSFTSSSLYILYFHLSIASSCSLASLNLKSRFSADEITVPPYLRKSSSTVHPSINNFLVQLTRVVSFSVLRSICRQRETKASENALPLPQQDVFVALKRCMCLLSAYVCLLWDWISETRLAAKGREGGEREEGRKRKRNRQRGVVFLDFVVFPVDVGA